MSIHIVCAWCGRDMGSKDGETGDRISHGICSRCVGRVRQEQKEIGSLIKQTKKADLDPYLYRFCCARSKIVLNST